MLLTATAGAKFEVCARSSSAAAPVRASASRQVTVDVTIPDRILIEPPNAWTLTNRTSKVAHFVRERSVFSVQEGILLCWLTRMCGLSTCLDPARNIAYEKPVTDETYGSIADFYRWE
jgi:hypothetical protein